MGKFTSSHKLSFVYNIARYTKWKNSLVNFCQKSKSSHDVGLTDIFKSKQSEGDNFLAKNKLGISLPVTFRTRKILKARLGSPTFKKASKSEGDYFLAKNKLGISLLGQVPL